MLRSIQFSAPARPRLPTNIGAERWFPRSRQGAKVDRSRTCGHAKVKWRATLPQADSSGVLPASQIAATACPSLRQLRIGTVHRARRWTGTSASARPGSSRSDWYWPDAGKQQPEFEILQVGWALASPESWCRLAPNNGWQARSDGEKHEPEKTNSFVLHRYPHQHRSRPAFPIFNTCQSTAGRGSSR